MSHVPLKTVTRPEFNTAILGLSYSALTLIKARLISPGENVKRKPTLVPETRSTTLIAVALSPYGDLIYSGQMLCPEQCSHFSFIDVIVTSRTFIFTLREYRFFHLRVSSLKHALVGMSTFIPLGTM